MNNKICFYTAFYHAEKQVPNIKADITSKSKFKKNILITYISSLCKTFLWYYIKKLVFFDVICILNNEKIERKKMLYLKFLKLYHHFFRREIMYYITLCRSHFLLTYSKDNKCNH